ncbi:putative polysaccharide biosynthesis protein [Paenibacillus alginolyticus]|uniref:Polysaccharide biosynthesis protein n=1 Tax=Paenibacillus alginolyticus TaxID=59839 RepID=A0ABT4GFC0_9BACL|nr:polysaccharide biosynthesis protein [Paenibacillus alginolyticus]MCY9694887.1 polysaccharide biosynthesis protein [Paenibacillus alginolyticus]MEC0147281.1 polysaccharide biosynthesis protein [Paenibacillus alginolyticus]
MGDADKGHQGHREELQRNVGKQDTKLLKGAALLGAAAILSKLLGTLQKIPLQNVAGDTAFGIYNAVYPLYILILFAATAGFPVAVSKFVAERAIDGDHQGARRIVHVSTAILMGTGFVVFVLLYFGASEIASWIGISQTERAIRSVSFALLLSPMLAVLRGYFQGYQNMVPTAVSQVIEQFIRVITMVALLLYMAALAYDEEWIAAGATFGSVTGAAAGLIVMYVYWRKAMRLERDRDKDRNWQGPNEGRRKEGVMPPKELSSWGWAKRITAYAIPVCLGAIVVPLLTLVDTFTMPRLLEAAQGSEGEAMRQFGLYNRGLPLVQLVVMIASSMSAVLVPALAEAKARRQDELIRSRAEMAIRLSWLIGLGASFGLAFAAVPINVMLYKSNEASWTMAVLAFTALFSTLNAVSASVLQGAGAIRTPVKALLVAIVLKALGNVVLMPRWGIDGAALSAVIAYAAAAGLNLVQLRRCTGARFALRPYAVSPALGVGLMGGCLAALQLLAMPAAAAWHVPERLSASAIALVGVVGGAAVYALALLRSGSISCEELRLMPELDRKLAPVLAKLWPAKASAAPRDNG